MVRTDNTVIAALALKRGDADAMVCGLEGRFERHLRNVTLIIGPRAGIKDRDLSTLSMLISQRGIIFLTDTHVSVDPTAEEIAEMTVLAAEEIQRFGIEPKAALLSHSDFGSRDSPSALKMRQAAAILARIAPELQCDGEMHADSALSEHLRQRVYPHSRLKGEANLLVFPNLDSANITLTALRAIQDVGKQGIIDLEGINAKLPLTSDNVATVNATRGVYNRDGNTMSLTSDITVTTTDGIEAKLKSVFLDMGKGTMKTDDPVDVSRGGSRITADSMAVQDNGKVLVFESKVRVNIDPASLKAAEQQGGESNASQ
ncbi:MAG: LPS export ABC transporter periplasmic protein LptC [Mesorhizobium sp.]|nr:MAG: LPS export ABC transporter periplasmic protein LptC [Mesorhizobium sp.]